MTITPPNPPMDIPPSQLRGQIGVRLPADLEIALMRILMQENGRRFYPLTMSDLVRVALIEYAGNHGHPVVDDGEPSTPIPDPPRRRGPRR